MDGCRERTVIEPEIAQARLAAEDPARQLETGTECVAIGRGQLGLEKPHHGGLPDREPAHVVLGKGPEVVDHGPPYVGR